jgi:AmpD protein
MLTINEDHLLTPACVCSSPYQNQRPDTDDISLLVVHCISLPRGEYGQPYIDALFCGKLDCTAHPDFSDLEGLEVSAHLVIARDGHCVQYVPFSQRAWHAGVSSFEGRSNCNDYAVGIELEGVDDQPFTSAQYQTLTAVTRALINRYPKLTTDRIVGHSDIAPGRKSDPGTGFDWDKFKHALATEKT